VGNDFLLVWKRKVHVCSGACALKEGLDMAQHLFSHGPAEQLRHLLHSFTATCLFVLKGFMVDVNAWSACMTLLTRLVCIPATPLIA
jgi:hypothetical protein